MNSFTTWIIARASEPSTWAGIGGFVASLTFIPSADVAIATKVFGLAATIVPSVLAAVLAEKGAKPSA